MCRHLPVEMHSLFVAGCDRRSRQCRSSCHADATNFGFFIVDEDECTRCALCIDRCPTDVISLGKFDGSLAEQAEKLGMNHAPWEVDTGQRDFKNGYAYGMRW